MQSDQLDPIPVAVLYWVDFGRFGFVFSSVSFVVLVLLDKYIQSGGLSALLDCNHRHWHWIDFDPIEFPQPVVADDKHSFAVAVAVDVDVAVAVAAASSRHSHFLVLHCNPPHASICTANDYDIHSGSNLPVTVLTVSTMAQKAYQE